MHKQHLRQSPSEDDIRHRNSIDDSLYKSLFSDYAVVLVMNDVTQY